MTDNIPETPDSATEQPNGTADEARIESCRQIALAGYILWAVSLVLGITCVVAVILAYVKRDDARGTWLESHFRWQIRTFWFSLLWGIIGLISTIIFVGIFILLAVAVWIIYRTVFGWVRLSEKRPLYQ